MSMVKVNNGRLESFTFEVGQCRFLGILERLYASFFIMSSLLCEGLES